MSDPGVLRLATRGSELARLQTESVASRIREVHGVEAELVAVSTTGDRRRDEPIWSMGGRGVFVKEVQEAVLRGDADAAVHSAKDLPSATPEGLALVAFPERRDPRDALIGIPVADLPTGAVVATGSVRRRAQLAVHRPDLTYASLRGNIPTRVERAAAHHAAVLSHAALERLGLTGHVGEVLDPSIMLPQVGQGALAVECRIEDRRVRELLEALDRPAVRASVAAERAFLGELGGGCNTPAGALGAEVGGAVELEVLVASLDGRIVLRHRVRGDEPVELGRRAARELLDGRGGRSLLEVAAV